MGANQCESGHCVDAICCESACDGQCEACDLTGSECDFSQVSGAPRGDRPPCEGAGTPCEGSCIDNPSVCTYEPVACGDSSCTDGVRTGGRCDVGNPGTCAPVTEECGAFACDSTATSCLAVCSKTEECAQGAVCRESLCAFVESAECDGDHTVVEPNGSLTDCSPFRCDGAACLNRCKIVDDCVDGKVCDQSGACVDPPPAPEPVEDCSFASPTGGKVNLLYFLALAGLASLSRRRGGSR